VWLDLIRLHILHYSEFVRLLSYSNLNPNCIPQTLLIAIYYSGYQFRKDKPPALTKYMERLFDLNFRKVICKPSFQNLQALYIYMNEYFGSGKLSLSRACLAHITRMSYALGIHINTNRFSNDTKFERKNLFREISSFDLLFSGSFKLKPSYIAELPNLDPSLYRASKYLIPENLLNSEIINNRLNMLKSTMNSFKKLYGNKTIELIRFDFVSATNDIELEKLCKDRLDLLNKSYNELTATVRKLKIEYSEFTKEIEIFEIKFHPSRFHIALIILEYGRINQFNSSQALLRETLKVCDNMYFYLQQDPNTLDFYNYLLCFTYLSILKQLDQIESGIIISRVNNIFETLSPDEFNNLNYLMLSSALKIIKK
ncbi:hypothetical protein CONCODRAFT_163580, partial [Conidiobolus coronatus NRRL 28638]